MWTEGRNHPFFSFLWKIEREFKKDKQPCGHDRGVIREKWLVWIVNNQILRQWGQRKKRKQRHISCVCLSLCLLVFSMTHSMNCQQKQAGLSHLIIKVLSPCHIPLTADQSMSHSSNQSQSSHTNIITVWVMSSTQALATSSCDHTTLPSILYDCASITV